MRVQRSRFFVVASALFCVPLVVDTPSCVGQQPLPPEVAELFAILGIEVDEQGIPVPPPPASVTPAPTPLPRRRHSLIRRKIRSLSWRVWAFRSGTSQFQLSQPLRLPQSRPRPLRLVRCRHSSIRRKIRSLSWRV